MRLIFFVALSMLISSCSPKYYDNSQNINIPFSKNYALEDIEINGLNLAELKEEQKSRTPLNCWGVLPDEKQDSEHPFIKIGRSSEDTEILIKMGQDGFFKTTLKSNLTDEKWGEDMDGKPASALWMYTFPNTATAVVALPTMVAIGAGKTLTGDTEGLYFVVLGAMASIGVVFVPLGDVYNMVYGVPKAVITNPWYKYDDMNISENMEKIEADEISYRHNFSPDHWMEGVYIKGEKEGIEFEKIKEKEKTITIRKTPYQKGKKHGKELRYSMVGAVTDELMYENGSLKSHFEYNNIKLKDDNTDKHKQKENIKHYDDDGYLTKGVYKAYYYTVEIPYTQGVPNGEATCSIGDQIKARFTYENGKIVGEPVIYEIKPKDKSTNK